jgi:hypothetical protein
MGWNMMHVGAGEEIRPDLDTLRAVRRQSSS